MILDGKKTAAVLQGKLRNFAADLEKQTGNRPGLAVVIVGEDPASQVYVANKSRTAKECGFVSRQYTLPEKTSAQELLALVEELNEDKEIHGILVQLPLPKHLDSQPIIQSIKPGKDVDGLSVANAGKVFTGDFAGALVSCTPAGAMLLLNQARGRDLKGLTAVVIGRSNLFGKPMGQLLLAQDATVIMAHSGTKREDLINLCRQADIVVAAVGRPQMVKGDWVKPGATVIDVGINRIPAPDKGEGKTRIVGDCDYDAIKDHAGAITPVPGGVGPMTIAMLMFNTVRAAFLAHGLPSPTL